MGRKIVIVLCLLLAVGQAWAANKYLWKDGNSGLECGASNIYFNTSWSCTGATGVASIQAAISNSGIAADDVVIIDGGPSSGAGITYISTDLDSDGSLEVAKRVHLRGGMSLDVGFTEHGGVFTFTGGATNIAIIYNTVANSIFSNFRIRGGNATGGSTYSFRSAYPVTLNDLDIGTGRCALYFPDGSDGSVVNRCVLSQSALTDYYNINITSGADGIVFNYCIFKDLLLAAGIYNYVQAPTVFNNCVFFNITGPAIMANTSVGTTITINNPMIINAASNADYPIYEIGSGAVVLNNPIITGAMTSYGRISSGDVTLNNPLYVNPKWVSARYPAILIFGVDDLENLSYFQSVSAKLKNYGWGGTFAMSSPQSLAGSWSDIATLINNGDDIAAHAASFSSAMPDESGIRVNYGGACGTGATVTVTSSEGYATNLSTTINGVADKNITITATMTLSQLAAQVNGGSYTSTELNAAAGEPYAKYLSDAAGVDICSTNADLNLDRDRVYNGEMTGSKNTIESGLLGVGTSYTVTSWVCPGNDTSANIQTGLLARGFTGSRGSSTFGSGSKLMSSINIFNIVTIPAGIFFGTADPSLSNVQIRVSGLAEYLKAVGGVAYIAAHNVGELTLDGWDKLLSEVQKSDVQVMTLRAAIEYMKSYNPSGDLATADNLTYTRTMVDALNMRLQPSSPAIDAGVAWQTYAQAQAAGVTVYGAAPDIGAYEYRKIESTIVPRPIIFDAPQPPCVSTNAACYVQ